MLIGVVALVVVGPQRLPGMMSTIGKWSSKLRRMLFDVRQQSGIDDILRAEGITGGINELRALRNAVRGNVSSLTQALTSPRPAPPAATPGAAATATSATAAGSATAAASTAASAATTGAPPPVYGIEDPFAGVPYDRAREYPDEGCDAYGAIPEDLWERARKPPVVAPLPEAPPEVTATDANSASEPAQATENDVSETANEPASEPSVHPDQDPKTTAP